MVGVQQNLFSEYLELVTKVGLQLKDLLSSVDRLVPLFPESAHKEVSIIEIICSYFQILFNSKRFLKGDIDGGEY